MAKSFKEQITWWNSPEDRHWKRRLQIAELLCLAAIAAACVAIYATTPGPKEFAGVVYLFGLSLTVSLAVVTQFIAQEHSVSRYVRFFVILGLGLGVGLLAGLEFMILSSLNNLP